MKIVQTFWSGNYSNIVKKTFGWYAPEYHIMSWALSCLQLLKFYDNVVLYTDKNGYKLLIEYLKLPYTDVIITLDELNNKSSELWALSKIYTYSKQHEAFLHIDGDIFIWEAFDKNLLKGELIAQNKEIGTEDFYKSMFNEIEKKLLYIPKEIKDTQRNEKEIFAYNAGIFGGNNSTFFKKYASSCIDFLNKNKSILNTVNQGNLNVYFEQYFFYCLARNSQQIVETFFKDTIRDNEYSGMGDFHLVPTVKKYIHLIGPFKRDENICKKMLRLLRKTYPDYYYKIIKLFPLKYENELQLRSFKKGNLINSSSGISTEKKEVNYYRTKFLYQKLTGLTITGNTKDSITLSNNQQLHDLYAYEKKIFEFVQHTLKIENQNLLKTEYLSIKSNEFFKVPFSEALKMTIRKSPYIKKVKSKWNWTNLKQEDTLIKVNFEKNIKEEPRKHLIILVAELEFPKYSEFIIDELDELILKIIKKPITIFKMLETLKSYFNPEELKSSSESFYRLIKRKIENLIFHKCISVLNE